MGRSVPAVLRGVVSVRRGAEGAVFSVDFTRIVMTVSKVNNRYNRNKYTVAYSTFLYVKCQTKVT